ncbi:TP53-binding protein 1 isoform X2 [Poecilia formosa]|uniref:TP53-binding protein 1 isoform X2 n=1 Tax=Poecilia formosa TaxID=48698 RepID=UPI0007B86CE7|nr:PREDICTED: tumor suppressor p53-binding protein 1-like isoform X2 [Poecilia formosa]
MDPGGSELDSSLPQPENPCLIVEDSQPDSVGLEDDPESSYRALLARRLSSLQPAARSPVLELISSPPGSRCSQIDSQSESNNQAEPEVVAAADPSSPLQEESQVINVCPHPTKKKFVPEDSEMDPGADSTTNCVQSDGGSSQFGFLELSQSQDLEAGGDPGHRSEKQQSVALKTLAHQDNKAVRSEVSSSSSSESVGQSGRQLTVQVLLHSQNLQESEEPDQQDCDVLSSQEDLFDADKSGAAVDSTVSEPEQPARPTSTPAHSLQLLHLSGQGTLVQESLSQSSVDYVAPTPDNFPHTPLIIASSPTEAENERDEEPMDTSLPPEERAAAQDEPMETDAASRPHSPTSAPVSQNASGPERALPVPSQPGLSHSQEARKSPPLPSETQSSLRESAPFSPALQLSVNADSGDPVLVEEDSQDSQDTQIDELEEPPGVDTSDAAAPEESHQPDRTEPDLPHESDRQQQEAETNVNESSNANHSDLAANSCVQETPCSTTAASHASSSGETAEQNHSTDKNKMDDCEEEEEDVMKEENTGGASAMALVLSESQLMSPEPMEEEIQDSVVLATDGEKDRNLQPESSVSEGDGAKGVATANGHRQQTQEERAEDALGGREMEGVKDKSLSDSSGDISFHFTLPKEGELIGPAVGSTPPPVSQLKQTLRHSTPIEITPFSEKPCGAGDDAAEAAADGEDGKLSLRMKLVTPVEEGGSERFSLQKPALSEEEEESVAAVTTVSTAVTSPSVFTRVRQAHRQQGAEDDPGNNAVIRGKLFASPQRSSQVSPLGCNSLPNSQSEPSQPDVSSAPQNNLKDAGVPAEPAGKRREPAEAPDLRPPTGVEGGQKEALKTPDGPNAATPSSKARQRIASQQPGVDGLGPRSPGGRGEPETPSFRRTAVPAHRRHVRTIQEVRTTVTRIITDVYYEDGREVDRRVTEESEEPVVDCQVLDSDISPCRTGSSSVTSGDLGDISSLSSKASSLHHSSGGTSGSTGPSRPDFVMPPSRGFRSVSPRRGGGHPQRGHRGQRAGSVVTVGRGGSSFVPLTPRGRARRGRPPSRSSPSRGGGAGPLQRLGALAQTHSSSEDEPFACMLPPRLPASPSDADPPARSDSLRSSPEAAPSAGSSFVGLRVVAKWSSNGYFYSGRIVKDAGDSRFRLRFDDGYECEVAGKDILLCDPIPLETEVTALLEDEYFSIGVIKGHKTEGQDLFYSVEKDGQRQWHNRTAVILSLDQGNKLREQHSLGPYEPTTPLTKASDISLDNLVEGKRRRRGTPGGANTPSRSSSGGARTPGPSGKRKLVPSEENKTPSKRGRRGGGARAGQRLSLCNTSGSGSDLPGRPSDVVETHGPLPQNSSLFMGFAFMLTASSEVDRMTNKVTSDDDEDYVQTGPYNKPYTESQLQAGGGFILPDFNEEQCKAAYQSLLIADQHCRTRKYLLCLASGVPCVSHIWVRDCCKENKLLNYRNYLLPAGVGPDDAIVEWHPRCSPFKALRVLLVSKKPDELWAQLVTMGGASSVRQPQTDGDASEIPAGKYDVVVADHTCPPAVERSVTSQEVPIVSPEWLIQSVICGERLGFNSRPQCSSSSSSS